MHRQLIRIIAFIVLLLIAIWLIQVLAERKMEAIDRQMPAIGFHPSGNPSSLFFPKQTFI